MRTKTKIMIGVISVFLIIGLVTFSNFSTVSAEDIGDGDPGDPGNSPGPGIDPNLCAIGNDDFKFTMFEIAPFQDINIIL